MKINVLIVMCIALLISCNSEEAIDKQTKGSSDKTAIIHDDQPISGQLPILGEIYIEEGDTVYHTIPPFGFTNQHKDTITHHTIDGKIHIADFIFTSCPGQCPKMTAAMKRIQQNCKDVEFIMLSYTIDPRRDTAETFQRYIEKAGIDDHNWHFLTGPKERIKDIGENGYMAVSGVDEIGKGDGDNHSNAIYLIDSKRRIRGLYSGTNPKEVELLIQDLKRLAENN